MRREWILGCALFAAACGQSAEKEASFEDVSTATLAYANCINDEAAGSARHAGSQDEVVEVILRACDAQRSTALERGAVPTMAASQAEFDEIHEGLARSLLMDAQEKAEAQ
ncbi:hypothetical protein [Qipengyuania aquimaris]|uniref:hypothetical protein n=1 Tax=Qipengyuania aquimaris TaxID=255984 RepID=UPI001CD2F9E1|nr:hypothetical protein [Qipengyuania aquimaris]MCA0903410.1 hypothetical protein [Qipengyuania aquimaris]